MSKYVVSSHTMLPSQQQLLKEMASNRGVGASQIIREALELYATMTDQGRISPTDGLLKHSRKTRPLKSGRQ